MNVIEIGLDSRTVLENKSLCACSYWIEKGAIIWGLCRQMLVHNFYRHELSPNFGDASPVAITGRVCLLFCISFTILLFNEQWNVQSIAPVENTSKTVFNI